LKDGLSVSDYFPAAENIAAIRNSMYAPTVAEPIMQIPNSHFAMYTIRITGVLVLIILLNQSAIVPGQHVIL
jgi:hypothetical protein